MHKLLPFTSSKMVNIDLTYPFDENTVYWPTEQLGKFKFTSKHAEVNTSFETYYEANRFSAAEHGGTHLDAPRHFVHGKLGVADISLEKLIGRLFLVDVSSEVDKNKDFLIMQEHIEQAETSLKRKVDDHIVLFYTGFSKHYPDLNKYLGTNTTNTSMLRFPGLHPDAATWLTERRKVKSVGIDTASIDYGQSSKFLAHRILFSHNVPAFENVNLKEITKLKSVNKVMIYALPMMIKNGSGAPLRIVASYDDDTTQVSQGVRLGVSIWVFLLLVFLQLQC
ncbi:kynurenine formamidase-like [Hydractinia symbiolongicarpus]|uniref:kynurenine formamidase-like n=1 Tax=Hydractinia symbiolongicarpus TaxID=13093 RepID=UPI0025513A2A|nr:kynurenine formamidase-like [Hydractinia symbiolongicarpus]